MEDSARQPQDLWSDALMAAALLAVDPLLLGGVALRAPAGEVRSAWIAHYRSCRQAGGQTSGGQTSGGQTSGGQASSGPWLQVPADVSDHHLLGGLDLERTLADGRPTAQRGALQRADGGLLSVAMAERLSASSAAIIAAALDRGEVPAIRDGSGEPATARFAVIAQDEGIAPDERPPLALLERLAIHLDLTTVSHRDATPASAPDIGAARRRLSAVALPDAAVEALCRAAAALGIASDRAPLFALRLARAAAALDGADAMREQDIALAARLVLAPRAMQLPAPPSDDQDSAPPPPPPDDDPANADAGDPDQAKALEDKVLDAAAAAIPADLLTLIRDNAQRAGRRGSGGKAGDARKAETRGRPIGSRKGDLRSRARLDLLDTLRAAAPWQRLRGREPGGPIKVRREDVRVRRFRDRMASTTIFVVDASGSAAMDRLGEAKGAVELLLADCYVRRDEVALIAFRGAGADILLPATRSLNRAKRSLAALPGGGGTPLASGLIAAERMADEVRRKGRTPTLVVITDGRANVCRDGMGGRQKAQQDAEAAATVIRVQGCRAILVDNAPRPEPKARSLADKMGAVYLALPHATAAALSGAVRADARSGARA
jgi:magnesium chelatase subunit D